MQEFHVPGFPFDQSPYGATLTLANDQVPFPVSRSETVSGVEVAFMNAEHGLGDTFTWHDPPDMGPAVIASGAQR